jgi:hypothetical protein
MKLRIKGITSRAGTLFLSFFQMVGQTKERNNGRPKERKEKRVLVKDSFSKMKKKKDDRAKRKGKGIRSIISLLFLFWKGIISRLLE